MDRRKSCPGRGAVEHQHPPSDQIVEVRGSVPYIEVDGKARSVKLNNLTLETGASVDPRFPPHWIFASNLRAQQSQVNFINTEGGGYNKELTFSVDLKSPVALEKAWIALGGAK